MSTPTHLANLCLEGITIVELQAAYIDGRTSVVEVVAAYLVRIAAYDGALRSVLELNPDALRIAAALDAKRKAGAPLGPLHGVPVLLKDNIDTHDKMHNTAGSRALAEWRPPRDSTVASKLRKAGAVILGKTNLSEWANYRGARSSSGWSGLGGQTRNPYDLTRSPCGSSSGSAVAVAANLCLLAVGTETNGSIVCPSSVNGIVGIKPTVGLISRAGIIPISCTQDTAGPMARTVRDAAICLGVLAGGIDPRDSATEGSASHALGDYTDCLNPDGLRGKRVGFYQKPLGKHAGVDALMAQAVQDLQALGAETIEVSEIYTDEAAMWSETVMRYEFKDGMNRYLAALPENASVRNLADLIVFNERDDIELRHFGQEVFLEAEATTGLDAPEYSKALANMQCATRAEGIDRVMDALHLDAIAAPTGAPAWTIDWVNGDHHILGSSSPAAMSGYPNISLPMGAVEGMPVGLSFFGRAWSEPSLLEVAYAYEQATGHRVAPELTIQSVGTS